ELRDSAARGDGRAHAARDDAASCGARDLAARRDAQSRRRQQAHRRAGDRRSAGGRSSRQRGAPAGGRAVKNLDPKRARWIRIRMGVLCGMMGLGLGAIVSGAYNIEVEDGESWYELAEKQRQRRLHITPKRGTIYVRNGTPLAESVEVPSVSVDAVE